MAESMLANLPVTVVAVINSPQWKGADLVVLDSAMGRPSANTIAKNHVWISAIVEHNPSKAIS